MEEHHRTDDTFGIDTSGALWAWGANLDGEIGDGTIEPRSMPVRIGTDTDWASVHASIDATLAIKTDGTLWGWGDNAYGQLQCCATGNVPTQIGTDRDWKAVTPARLH